MANGSLITEELRKLIGVTLDTIVFKVEEGAIQRYGQAIGDPNPLYNDPDFARKTKLNPNLLGRFWKKWK